MIITLGFFNEDCNKVFYIVNINRLQSKSVDNEEFRRSMVISMVKRMTPLMVVPSSSGKLYFLFSFLSFLYICFLYKVTNEQISILYTIYILYNNLLYNVLFIHDSHLLINNIIKPST